MREIDLKEPFETDYFKEYYTNYRNKIEELFDSERHFVYEFINDASSCLDIGCAIGGMFNILSTIKPKLEYTGVDLSPKLIDEAKRLHPKATFMVNDGIKLPFSDNDFTHVISLGTTVHDQNYKQLIEEAWRVTGDKLLFDIRITPNETLCSIDKAFVEDGTGMRYPYVVANASDLFQFVASLSDVKIIKAYGYWGSANIDTTLPHGYEQICMACILLQKKQTRKSVCVSLNLPTNLPVCFELKKNCDVSSKKNIIVFRNSGSAYAEKVIKFSRDNGFTQRQLDSWYGEKMDAAIVLDNNHLVGAIPFASRLIGAADDAPLKCGYFSGVAVNPIYRNKGYGTKLLEYLFNSSSYDGFMVNSYPDDLAYAWYIKNEFYPVMRVWINILKSSLNRNPQKKSCEIYELGDNPDSIDILTSAQPHLQLLFTQQYHSYSGFEVRDDAFWIRKLKHHYYKAFNQYYLLQSYNNQGYMIVAYNTHPNVLPDGQIDILELAFQNEIVLEELLMGVKLIASQNNTDTIRCAVTEGSFLEGLLKSQGFHKHQQFNILYRPISERKIDTNNGLFFLYDYA